MFSQLKCVDIIGYFSVHESDSVVSTSVLLASSYNCMGF